MQREDNKPLAPPAFQLHPLCDQTGYEASANAAEGSGLGAALHGLFLRLALQNRPQFAPRQLSLPNDSKAPTRAKIIIPCPRRVSSVG